MYLPISVGLEMGYECSQTGDRGGEGGEDTGRRERREDIQSLPPA
jgi:hypothetical protein